MTSFTSEDLNIHILDEGLSVHDFTDQRINELSRLGNKDAFHTGDLGDVLEKHLRWVRKLPRVVPFYAIKCNNNTPIISMLADLGACFDCASRAEINQVLSLGVAPGRIIYANPYKQESHIRYACIRGVQMMTFDSSEELTKISQCHDNAKLVLRIAVDDSKSSLRLNCKFGARLYECHSLLERARELCLEVIGVSFHVGSGCQDPEAYRQAISDARSIYNVGVELGFNMTLLDIGGGYPGYDGLGATFEEIADTINFALEDYFPAHTGVQVIAEPGRYYVQSAFTLAMNIIGKKVNEAEDYNKDDRIIMYYVNDGVHGSFNRDDKGANPQMPYAQKKSCSGNDKYPSIIWGPTCDSHDMLMNQCALPELDSGDWLLVDNMGAYTVVMGSNFNGFKRADTHFVMTNAAWKKMQHICSQRIKPHRAQS